MLRKKINQILTLLLTVAMLGTSFSPVCSIAAEIDTTVDSVEEESLENKDENTEEAEHKDSDIDESENKDSESEETDDEKQGVSTEENAGADEDNSKENDEEFDIDDANVELVEEGDKTESEVPVIKSVHINTANDAENLYSSGEKYIINCNEDIEAYFTAVWMEDKIFIKAVVKGAAFPEQDSEDGVLLYFDSTTATLPVNVVEVENGYESYFEVPFSLDDYGRVMMDIVVTCGDCRYPFSDTTLQQNVSTEHFAVCMFNSVVIDEDYENGEYEDDLALDEAVKDEIKIEDVLYTGRAVKPAVYVKRDGNVLTEGKDYTLKYANNIRVGTKVEGSFDAKLPTVVITGKGDYSDVIKMNFSILPANFTENADSFTYTYKNELVEQSKELKPTTTIKYNGIVIPAVNYTVSYRKDGSEELLSGIPANSNGKYYIVIEMKPNNAITGKVELPLTVLEKEQRTMSMLTISIVKSKACTGEPITLLTERSGMKSAEIVVKNGKTVLTAGTDYTIEYENNTKVGTASVILTGKGNYLGTITKTFKITGYPVSKLIIKYPTKKYFTGENIVFTEEELVVKHGNEILKVTEPGSNENGYYPVYKNNYNSTDNGASVVIVGTGKYTGSVEKFFMIQGNKFWSAVIQPVEKMTYNGEAQIPNFVLTYKLTTPEKVVFFNADCGIPNKYKLDDIIILDPKFYDVELVSGGTNAGRAEYVLRGKGVFKRAKRTWVTIERYNVNADGSKVTVSDIDPIIYSKGGNTPKSVVKFGDTVLKEGKDYTVKYSNNNIVTNSASVTYSFTGNFTGSIKKTFKISGKELDESFTFTANDVLKNVKAGTYKTSLAITGSNGKRLTPNVDFDYKNAKYYIGSVAEENLITSANFADLKSKLVGGTKIIVVVNGINNYSGSLSAEYHIVDLMAANVKVAVKDKSFTGSEITVNKDDVIAYIMVGGERVNLEYGVDFEMIPNDSLVKAGVHYMTFKPIANPESDKPSIGGTKKVSFRIAPRGITYSLSYVYNKLLGR